MSNADFAKLSDFIYSEYGIKMPLHKKLMLQGRLRSRLKDRNIDNYRKYIDFLFSDKGKQIELVHMIDVVTTNKTDFFREPDHFDFLYEHILNEFQKKTKLPGRVFKIWSAGCATGEEPYTIAIILSEFKALHAAFDFSILATDISSMVLKTAGMAVYPENKVAVLPLSLKQNYLLKSKNRTKKTIRIVASLRSKVNFERQNLMDVNASDSEMFDTIFCRNTLIYFDNNTQNKVILNLCRKLRVGGYLFIGHSETIMKNDHNLLVQVKPTIYQKV